MRPLFLLTACAAALAPTFAAAEAGDVLVRLRGITVAPTGDSGSIQPSFPGASIDVQEAYVPELDFTYFFTDHLAAELILATSPHDIEGRGDIGALGEIAETWALPPTLTLQYHFTPDKDVRPYVGVGINYTIFYSEQATASLDNAIGETQIDIDDSVGFAVQAGVDVTIKGPWFFNADIKYIDIDADATLRTGDLTNTVSKNLNPIVAGVGFGYRF